MRGKVNLLAMFLALPLGSCQSPAQPTDAASLRCLHVKLENGDFEYIVRTAPPSWCRSQGAEMRMPLHDRYDAHKEAMRSRPDSRSRVRCLILTPGHYRTAYTRSDECAGQRELRQVRIAVPDHWSFSYRFHDDSIDHGIVDCRLLSGVTVLTSRSSCAYEGGMVRP